MKNKNNKPDEMADESFTGLQVKRKEKRDEKYKSRRMGNPMPRTTKPDPMQDESYQGLPVPDYLKNRK